MVQAKIRDNDQDYVSPKQRDLLNEQKEKFFQDIDRRLASLPKDSYDRPDLERMRSDAFSRFPEYPADLRIWKIAYFEQVMKAIDRVRDAG
jgi:hypothetical protein